MNCEKCEASLPYGTKYCNACGEKVPKGAYDSDYNDTIWAKIDKIKDEYDSLFLKKITGSLVFKLISLAVVLGYFFFTMYGNLNGIRLRDSDAYTIEYNEKADEYYIQPKEDTANLELFVPVGTDDIVFTAVSGGEEADVKEYTTEEYRKRGYTVSEGQYEYVRIDAVRGGKVADSVKIIAVK